MYVVSKVHMYIIILLLIYNIYIYVYNCTYLYSLYVCRILIC